MASIDKVEKNFKKIKNRYFYKYQIEHKKKFKIIKRDFINAKILLTGDGRVAKGSLELLNYTNIVKKNKDEYLQDHNSSIYCNLTTAEYVDPVAGAPPNLTVLPSKAKPSAVETPVMTTPPSTVSKCFVLS